MRLPTDRTLTATRSLRESHTASVSSVKLRVSCAVLAIVDVDVRALPRPRRELHTRVHARVSLVQLARDKVRGCKDALHSMQRCFSFPNLNNTRVLSLFDSTTYKGRATILRLCNALPDGRRLLQFALYMRPLFYIYCIHFPTNIKFHLFSNQNLVKRIFNEIYLTTSKTVIISI